jgi:hypothetical protein
MEVYSMTLIEQILDTVEFRDVEGLEGREKAILDRSDWEKLVTVLKLVDQKGEDFGHFTETATVERIPVTLEQLVAQITPENMHGETSTGQAVGDEVW